MPFSPSSHPDSARGRRLAVAAVAVALLAAALATPALGVAADPVLLAGLLALTLLAAMLEAPTPGATPLRPGLVFVVAGALLLPAPAIVLLAGACYVRGLLGGAGRRHVALFEAAVCTLAGLAMRGALEAVGALDAAPSALTVLETGAAALGFVAVVDLLRAAFQRLAWRRPLVSAARALHSTLALDTGLALSGAAVAVLWREQPWLVAALAGPVWLASRALLVPALRHKSRTDPKTGLFNFEHLREALDDAVRTATRRKQPVAVVMIDLDHLRTINNTFGHLAGDQAILRVARALGAAAEDRGIAARFGGEEFCLLLPGYSAEAAAAIVDVVRRDVGDLAWRAGERVLRCSFSAGVAALPDDGEDVRALLSAADQALYDAKSSGRGCVRLALPADARADLALDLTGATTTAPQAMPLPAVVAAPALPVEVEDEAADADGADDDDAPAARRWIPALVAALLTAVVGVVVAAGPQQVLAEPLAVVLLVAAVVVLDRVRIDLFTGLNLSAASVPTLTLALLAGPAGVVAGEAVIALSRLLRRQPHIKWSFDLGALSLSGAAAAVVFAAVPTTGALGLVGAGAVAGLAYFAVNTVLMAVVIWMSSGKRPLAVWRDGLAWLWVHFLLYGGMAGGITFCYDAVGIAGIVLFAVPVAGLWLGQRQYVHRSRASVEQLRRSRDELELANARLQRLVDEKRDLVTRVHGSYLSTITSLARTIEAKDPYTGGHTDRVSRVTSMLAEQLGLPHDQRQAAEVGAAIHDIGKVGVPDEILLKPDRLDAEEQRAMRRHPEISSYIVGALDLPPVVKHMVRNHHERYDGTGYPDRLAGEEIPLAARVLAVADTLDAITSDRPYRRGQSLEDAVREIRGLAGTQFCPSVVEALLTCLERDPTLGGAYRPSGTGRFARTVAAV